MNEGEITTNESLELEWKRVLNFYDKLIENGFTLRPIRFIVRHIIDKGYNKVLFPGTSLYSLLISIPRENRVSYDKTLHIQFDELRKLLRFSFTDQSGQDRHMAERKEYLKWEETCQLSEGIALIESFFASNNDFRDIIEQELKKN
jgi:hypothetical protein